MFLFCYHHVGKTWLSEGTLSPLAYPMAPIPRVPPSSRPPGVSL